MFIKCIYVQITYEMSIVYNTRISFCFMKLNYQFKNLKLVSKMIKCTQNISTHSLIKNASEIFEAQLRRVLSSRCELKRFIQPNKLLFVYFDDSLFLVSLSYITKHVFQIFQIRPLFYCNILDSLIDIRNYKLISSKVLEIYYFRYVHFISAFSVRVLHKIKRNLT